MTIEFHRGKLSAYHISTRYLNALPRYYYFRFWNQTADILKFYFLFRFWPIHCHRHVIRHWPTQFYANWMIDNVVMTSYWFYKMAAIEY